MGDMADYYREQELLNMYGPVDFDDPDDAFIAQGMEQSYKNKTLIWTTKTGQEINVSQMGRTHLINTVKFLERKEDPTDITLCWIELLNKEISNREE